MQNFTNYTLVKRAMDFAKKAHGDQKRKYSGNPYWYHLRDVAHTVWEAGLPHEAVAAAWLHDTIEDTDVTYDDVKNEFGKRVADLVNMVTDVSKPEDGNRKTRKAMDREHLAQADAMGQSIKLADVASNSYDIAKNDPNFARVYIPEMEALMKVLTKGDKKLYAKAQKSVEDARGNCEYSWQRAADGSKCGKRAKK